MVGFLFLSLFLLHAVSVFLSMLAGSRAAAFLGGKSNAAGVGCVRARLWVEGIWSNSFFYSFGHGRLGNGILGAFSGFWRKGKKKKKKRTKSTV
ncbi:hypothetical protein LY76DRAFT_598970 [Colletotrichum caudatum]|nr:hypothetical protein LY76DRAFT_598970 [Colletotrichum caudatum]